MIDALAAAMIKKPVGAGVAGLAALALGCGGGPATGDAGSVDAAADASWDPGFFDPTVLHELRLTVAPADFQTLRDRYLEDIWVPATLEWGDERIENIGIRSRGNGSRSPVKPGLRVDFDQYVSDQRFHGLKTIVLDNLLQDGALMKERLAFGVFASRGIPAPRLVHARLSVNGEYLGVYTVVEAVNKTFVRARYGETDGNLFDYEWVDYYYFAVRGPDAAAYVPIPFEPKTNETSLDPSALLRFVETANSAADATLVAELATFIDLDAWISYLAVETAIAERDGLAGDWGLNNFYLYQRAGTSRFELLPWDKDYTFHDPAQDVWLGVGDNVLLGRLLVAPGPLRDRYLAELRAVVETQVNDRVLLPEIETVYQLIRDAVPGDLVISPADFEANVEHLRTFARTREAAVLGR